jgi:hypothetical protein
MIYILCAIIILVAWWMLAVWLTWSFFTVVVAPAVSIGILCMLVLWIKYRLTGRL